MKYFAILIILIGFTAITCVNTVYGMWFPQSPDELFKQSEIVFVGNINSVNVLEFERSNTYNVEENGISRIIIENYTQTLDEYTVNIEEFLKNPQESNTITMLEATVGGVPGRSVSIGGFELGDRVLFYVPKIDGINQYSPESFKIPKQCDVKSALEQPRIEGGNSFNMIQEGIVKENNFIANKSIQFVYRMDMRSLDEKNFDFKITIRKETDADKFGEVVLSETIPVKSKMCEWIATATAEFVPQVGNYQMGIHTTEITGSSTFGGNFSVEENSGSYDEIISPLKQIKSGISIDEIQCRDDLVLIQKYDGSPACVTTETISKLVAREWGTSDNWIKISNSNKAIHYELNNAMISSISAYSEYTNQSLPEEKMQTWLQVKLESTHDGSLQITLPRNLIDAKINTLDDEFFVLLDGIETKYQETKTNSERILDIHFPAKIDIVEIVGYGYYNSELNQFGWNSQSESKITNDTEMTMSITPQKSYYLNSETIHVVGHIDNKSLGYPVGITIVDWKGNIVKQGNVVLDHKGNFNFLYEISEFCKSGKYDIILDDYKSGKTKTVYFDVQHIQTKSIYPECKDGELLNCGVCKRVIP